MVALSPEQKKMAALDLALGRQQFNADLSAAHGHTGRDVSDHALEQAKPGEMDALARKRAALDNFFTSEIKAKFKIEVTFGKGRSTKRSFPGALHLYLSGSALGGGGDELLYPCPDVTCMGVIGPDQRIHDHDKNEEFAVCPICKFTWGGDKLQEGRLYKLSGQRWAEVVAREYVRLGHDADIYLKSHPVDIRSKALLEQMKERRGAELVAARGARVPVMYPLNRLLKDLTAGADLEKRLLAFITA